MARTTTRAESGSDSPREQRKRRTVRLRLTAVYGGLFLLAGASLIAITALLWSHATSSNLVIQKSVPIQILRIAEPTPAFSITLPGASLLNGGRLLPVVPERSRPVLKAPPNPKQVSKIREQLWVVAHEQRDFDLQKLLLFSGVAFAAVALLTIALTWLTAGRVLRPLRTITSRARDISASNLHERLSLEGPRDELGELGETIDQLLGRLERSFEAQRLFVANASHELRTPLATMRASVDVALGKPGPTPPEVRQLASRLNGELDHVDRLLESFLALARAEAVEGAGEEPLRFDTLVSEAVARQSEPVTGTDIEVQHEPGPATWVTGDPLLLRRLVDNLLDNAVRHNRSGGRVEVRLEREQALARLVVENDGRVLDPEAVAGLVRPFRRFGADRVGSAGGFGLGLTIVRSIAESHGGRVELEAREEGGLRVAVELPLAARSLAMAGQ